MAARAHYQVTVDIVGGGTDSSFCYCTADGGGRAVVIKHIRERMSARGVMVARIDARVVTVNGCSAWEATVWA